MCLYIKIIIKQNKMTTQQIQTEVSEIKYAKIVTLFNEQVCMARNKVIAAGKACDAAWIAPRILPVEADVHPQHDPHCTAIGASLDAYIITRNELREVCFANRCSFNAASEGL